jgi:aminoglycoside phosphotransferase (APT) family kinase protein
MAALTLFSPGPLGAYLSARLDRNIVVDEITRFPRGSSRSTFFVTYHDDGQAAAELVLRTDLPAGSTEPTSLEQEYFIYERLGHTDVPVARAVLFEHDPGHFGQAFYLREKIEGDWNIPFYSDPDPQYDALRIAIAREHIRKLAMVHAVDWRSLGFAEHLPVPVNEADAAHCYIRSLRALYDDIAIEPMPIVAEACEWLHDHAPVAPRLCLCKGTNGHGEEVFRDGKLVALSDWEEASIGDPAADFAFMQGFLSDIERDGKVLWNSRMAASYYTEISGIELAVESIGYYQLVRALRLLIMMQNAGKAVHRRAEPDIRQTWSATEVLHICKHILASAMGMMPAISAERFSQLNATVDMQ